jgi:hypothetical protein
MEGEELRAIERECGQTFVAETLRTASLPDSKAWNAASNFVIDNRSVMRLVSFSSLTHPTRAATLPRHRMLGLIRWVGRTR